MLDFSNITKTGVTSQHWHYFTSSHARLPAPGPLFEYAHLVSTDAPRQDLGGSLWRCLSLVKVGGHFVCRCLTHGGVSKPIAINLSGMEIYLLAITSYLKVH